MTPRTERDRLMQMGEEWLRKAESEEKIGGLSH